MAGQAHQRSTLARGLRLLVLMVLAMLVGSACRVVPTETPTLPAVTETVEPGETPTEATEEPTASPEPGETATPDEGPTPSATPPDTTEGHLGDFAVWSKVEIELDGPESEGMSDEANPFKVTAIVNFTGPEGQLYRIPAFYAGDGAGGLDGNIWQVRFAPDAAGRWSFKTFSDEPLLDHRTGTFDATPPTGCGEYEPGGMPDPLCMGRLQSVGELYLQFADGTYWLKGGADEPEDFLAPDETAGFESKEAALDYLAGQGVNSIYMMLHNVGGDGRNVWPWVGETEAEARANHEHFDIAKLERWEEVFTHAQEQGVLLHLVFEDDSAWNGFNREMYYREMIARFGHHNALYWNLAEEYEELYRPDQIAAFAEMVAALDAYDHPITVHHVGSTDAWRPFVNDENFGITSFQTGGLPGAVNSIVVEWRGIFEEAGRIIPVSIDEAAEIEVHMRELSRQLVWATYAGGGNFEMFTRNLEDYRDFELQFADMTLARSYIESLPFTEMEPMNELVQGAEAFVFAQPGEVYTVYALQPEPFELDLRDAGGEFQASWLDPETGDVVEEDAVAGGEVVAFEPPLERDSVLYLGRESLNERWIP